MDATKPYKFIGIGAMDATKPYKFIGFGTMDATKPYKFIGFGAMDATRSASEPVQKWVDGAHHHLGPRPWPQWLQWC